MPRPRSWSSLSDSTQKRYRGAGITPALYEAGADLRAARGHARTPERAIIETTDLSAEQRERFSDYLETRRELIIELEDRKRELWGEEHKFNGRRSDRQTRGGSVRDMRFALRASIDDLEQLAGSGDERWSFLWYH